MHFQKCNSLVDQQVFEAEALQLHFPFDQRNLKYPA